LLLWRWLSFKVSETFGSASDYVLILISGAYARLSARVEELGFSTLEFGRIGFNRQLVNRITEPAAMQTVPKMSATTSGQNSDHHWLPVRGRQPPAGQLVE
jgi:hypothetical protein